MLPIFSDWTGIAGLLVGIAGLTLTLFTFWKVKTIQAVVVVMQRKHLFAVRVPEHIDELKLIVAQVLTWRANPPKEDFHLIAESLAKIKNICASIKEYCESDVIFSQQFGSLKELNDLASLFLERKNIKLRRKDWNDWYTKLRESIDKVEIILRDQEVKLL